MTRSEPPADVISNEDLGDLIEIAEDGLDLPSHDIVLCLRELTRLRASSSLGGIEGGVQREDALTAGALVEKQAVDGLCQLAYAAWCLADDSEDLGDGFHKVDHDNFVKLCDALDLLNELPDDQPGYTMEAAAKARWALRGIGGDAAGALTAEKAAHPVFAFLLGSGPLNGHWFGDAPPRHKGKRPQPFWWRFHLRAALAENVQAPDAGIRSALPPSSARERREIIEECANLLDLRAQDIQLIAGEMSAQEMRSVRAMLNERARAIRALSSDGRVREKGNTSNASEGVDPSPT